MANKKIIEECKALIYEVFDKNDPTGLNTEFYVNLFAKMSDEDFVKLFEKDFPLRYQQIAFKNELNMVNIINGLKVIKVPLLEKITLGSYRNEKGEQLTSLHEGIVGFAPMFKMKQFVTKKSRYNTNINVRNNKTGHIIGNSKGVESDREFETLELQNLSYCSKELSRAKADDMDAKNRMYLDIYNKGIVYAADLKSTKSSQISRKTLDTYLIGSCIKSNLLSETYMTPYTLSVKKSYIAKKM